MLFGKDGRSKEARNIKKATSGIIKANKSKKKKVHQFQTREKVAFLED